VITDDLIHSYAITRATLAERPNLTGAESLLITVTGTSVNDSLVPGVFSGGGKPGRFG